jgi:EAL domain-containing protein (putative c-di-GMP-specific phosphodiesterase class I)
MGVRICMDDFGAGYCALSYLRNFPFDKIKIDRSFLSGDSWTRDGIAVVRAVVGLGRAFDMAIVAEGVETKEQSDAVRAEGCDEAQGFLFYRGLPDDQIYALLKDQNPPLNLVQQRA